MAPRFVTPPPTPIHSLGLDPQKDEELARGFRLAQAYISINVRIPRILRLYRKLRGHCEHCGGTGCHRRRTILGYQAKEFYDSAVFGPCPDEYHTQYGIEI